MADTVRKASYYYATIPDRAGEGARLLQTFKNAGVNFSAIHAFPVGGGKSQIDFFPSDTAAFEKAAKAGNVALSARKTAFVIEGDDRVGVAEELLGKLGAAGVNVIALDAVCSGKRFGGILWVKPGDVEKAAKALGA